MKFKYKEAAIVAVVFALGMFVGARVFKNMQARPQDPNAAMKEIMRLVKENYVDNVNVDSVYQLIQKSNGKISDSLNNAAISKLLEGLDPHSVYLPPTQLKQANEEMMGSFAGVGIEYTMHNDTMFVTYVEPNGPASKAGVAISDIILKAGDSSLSGVKSSNSRLRSLLRGGLNSEVKVTVQNKLGSISQKTIIRGNIELSSIDAAYMIDPKTGYIKLNKFSMNSHDELKDALSKLVKKGMTALIFDLRDNPGGSLRDAVNIVDEFVSGTQLVTYTQGNKKNKETYNTSFDGLFEQGKLAVLIDEGSASASEIVAGALQDLDRATIVGRRSYGKGLVQQQYSLPGNAALRLTIARYYIPSGRSIQKDYSQGKQAYNKDIHNRYNNSSLIFADSNYLDKSKVYKTKAGRTVYGGGGVMPDLFVALDTTRYGGQAFNQLGDKGLLSDFAAMHYINNLAKINTYLSSVDFAKNYIITEADWQQFAIDCAAEKVNIKGFNSKQITALKEYIVQLIIRLKWRNQGVIEALNLKDTVVLKAKEKLHAN